MNVISRGRGQSAVAAAAYRAGARLKDDRYGIVHDYTKRRPAAYSEVLMPAAAPDWAAHRESLWNRVELAEQRKDAQLARAVDASLPAELSGAECVALVRDYCTQAFVSQGMVVDAVLRRDVPDRPHAYLLLTLRPLLPDGFGRKERQWNGKAQLLEWRRLWAQCANLHLARGGHAVRIDHRTLEAQQIELTPARRVGGGRLRERGDTLPRHMAERLAQQQRIAHDNGQVILEDPAAALRALALRSDTFDLDDVARFLRSRTSAAQYAAVYLAVTRSEELVAVGDAAAGPKFTTRDLIEAARSLRQRAIAMQARRGHGLDTASLAQAGSRVVLSDADRRMFEYLVSDGAIKASVFPADAGMAAPVAAACLAWEAGGFRPTRACDGLLDRRSVLLIDAADMLGLKELERDVAAADRARAKVILLGDSTRLAALRPDSAFLQVQRELGGREPG